MLVDRLKRPSPRVQVLNGKNESESCSWGVQIKYLTIARPTYYSNTIVYLHP